MFTQETEQGGMTVSSGLGLFQVEGCGGDTCIKTDNECNAADGSSADCASGVDSKCKSGKAFIILGCLSTAAAAGLVVSGAGPAIARAAAGGFASFSYMIVFALYASIMNADAVDCGLADSEFGYGAAFFLTVIAFLLSAVGAAAAFMAGGSE